MRELDEISLAIGALQSTSAQLLKLAEDHDRDTATLRQEVQGVSTKVDRLSVKVEEVKRDMATVMPVVRRVQNWHQRAIGISLVGGLLGGWFAQIKGWFG